jgi:hypothetical protein
VRCIEIDVPLDYADPDGAVAGTTTVVTAMLRLE